MPSRSPFQAVSIVASSGVPARSSAMVSPGALAGCAGEPLCGDATPVDGAGWPHATLINAARTIAVRSVALMIVVEVSWMALLDVRGDRQRDQHGGIVVEHDAVGRRLY